MKLRLSGINDMFHKAITDSTMLDAKRIANQIDDNFYVTADEQLNGVGRFGNAFCSPEGGVYVSFCWRTDEPLKNEILLTTYVGVTLCKLIRNKYCIDARIKWINDIYLDERKVAGILAEKKKIKSKICYIIGVGINCDICSEISGAVKAAALGTVNKAVLVNELACMYECFFIDAIDKKLLIQDARSLSCILNRTISFIENNITYRGIAVDLNDDGCLIVKMEDGFVELNSSVRNVRVLQHTINKEKGVIGGK